MRVAIGSSNPAKKEAVSNVFSRVFDAVEVIAQRVDSGVPPQPRDDEVVLGARQRAERSFALTKNSQLGIGIEAGLFSFLALRLIFKCA